MSSVADRLKELEERQRKEKALGGPERVKKQHDSGKLTARERLDILFDRGSFHELDMFVRH
ncbi:methylmalonyl-CoA carboxyltransferase, partial [Dehalococcoidia bacterium]|nr:methylmalonyl-CoA carboxyltransferase [Dehalococcoidia bacterium]